MPAQSGHADGQALSTMQNMQELDMDVNDLQARFAAMQDASRAHLDVPYVLRRERLLRLRKMIAENADAMCAAVQSDYGQRSARMTELTELLPLRSQLAHTLGHLRRWMKPKRVATPLHLQPASAWVQAQALGVVGVIAPWNYPLLLTLGPVLSALAAGNRVLVKPSEFTPATSQLLAQLVESYFDPLECTVLQGDASAAAQLASLPLDHLLFTGSTAVGRKVAMAAAHNLVPTTLELGGKSPVLLEAGCDLRLAARSIAHGKLLNAGQTCIAPDYVLVPRGSEVAFVDAYWQAVRSMYPVIQGNPDYASIIHAGHASRLHGLLQQAQQQGAQVLVYEGAAAPAAVVAQNRMGDGISRQMAPCVVLGVSMQMQLMQEEIFGPILPVLQYDDREEALNYIRQQPSAPLALYWFGSNQQQARDVLARTRSGTACLNDTLLQFVHDGLPFGGLGASGWGAVHGEAGFTRFSHAKSVFRQSKWAPVSWLYPPYEKRFDTVMAGLRRLFLR